MSIIEDSKPWWTSKTVLSATAAIIAGFFGLTDADATEWAGLVTDVVTVFAGFGAIYGRKKAKRPIR